MSRFVLRYRGGTQAPKEEIARIRASGSLRVLEESGKMLLVEAEEGDLNRLLGDLRSWLIVPERTYSIPDPRPKLKKPRLSLR